MLLLVSCVTSQRNVYKETDYVLVKVDSFNNRVGTAYYVYKYDSSRRFQIDYYADGKLMTKSFTHNKRLDGRWEMHDDNGDLMAVDSFKEGVKTYSKNYFAKDRSVKIFKNGKLAPLDSSSEYQHQ